MLGVGNPAPTSNRAARALGRSGAKIAAGDSPAATPDHCLSGLGVGWPRRRVEPIFGAELDSLLQLRFFDNPEEIIRIARGNLRVGLAAIFSEVEARMQSGLGRPFDQLAPASVLDQFLEDGGGDDHVEGCAVG